MSFRFVVLLISAVFLSACSNSWESQPPETAPGGVGLMGDGTLGEGPGAVASVTTAPTANSAGVTPPFGSSGTATAYEFGNGYRIGAGDRLTVKVMGQAELTSDYLVDGAGKISMPLIGTTRVAGLTAERAARLIARKLRKGYLRKPAVSVQVSNPRPFFILGEVNQAGSFSYQPGMTVQNAIAIASGYNARANHGAVLLTRKSAKGTITRKVPVTTQLYPGDIVFVRERWF